MIQQIKHSLSNWANSLGWSNSTLEERLVRAGIQKLPREKITALEIKKALQGDIDAARAKNLELDAQRKDREEKQAHNELVTAAIVEQWLINHYVVPINNLLNSAPSVLAAQCNPADPAVALKAIADWVENVFKPALNQEIEKPINEDK